MIRGFDVSEAQGYLDNDFWQQAVDMDMKFVYARCSWGNGHEDTQFRHNVKMAHNYGLKVGAYHYDYSLTPDATAEHARKCAAIIADAGVLLELPVFFDLEDADDWKYRNGYDFTGWYSDKTLMQKITKIKLNENKTVYAGWTKLTSDGASTQKPPTGDSNELLLWSVLLLISGFSIINIVLLVKKKKGAK